MPCQCELLVRVTPRASTNDVSVAEDGTVKARVTAAPTDGQANAAVIVELAERLGVAKSRLDVVRGQTSRLKVVRIQGLTLEEATAKLSDTGSKR